jgi:predicted MFS family arabinose efflux permease
MRTLFYIFAICFAGLFLFVTVNRFERNRPLATLLMILLVGITAAAVLKQLMP